MSFKSREKKRQAGRSQSGSAAELSSASTMAGRHYLTIVSRSCCCNDCGGSLRKRRRVRLPIRAARDSVQTVRRRAGGFDTAWRSNGKGST